MLTLIRDAHIVTQNAERQVLRGDILVRDGVIEQVGGTVRDSSEKQFFV
jgi:dihydroorotase-like cyclic amidohydrolase